ncbi:hypothetical protein BKI52_39825 [marine bacterium AO1-C]|nr:hypothetical protein BKI52_39825 [marine bacterium AO1-C]
MGKNLTQVTTTFYVCDGGSCRKAGSDPVMRATRAYLRNQGLWDTTHTIKTRCIGRCEDAPAAIVHPGDYWYKNLDAQNVIKVMKKHLEEDKPVEELLVFKEGSTVINSDKERPKKVPKPFSLVEDEDLGLIYSTRGFSTDQYTYPLFLYLAETKGPATLTFPHGQTHSFRDIQSVEYGKYQLEVVFNDATLAFTLAGIPKTEPMALQRSRVLVTEFFYEAFRPEKRGIRLKDKMGRLLAIIWLDPADDTVWNYCLKVQLGMSEVLIQSED